MLILVLPWFAMAVWQYGIAKARMVERVIAGAMVLAALVIFSLTQDYETQFAQRATA